MPHEVDRIAIRIMLSLDITKTSRPATKCGKTLVSSNAVQKSGPGNNLLTIPYEPFRQQVSAHDFTSDLGAQAPSPASLAPPTQPGADALQFCGKQAFTRTTLLNFRCWATVTPIPDDEMPRRRLGAAKDRREISGSPELSSGQRLTIDQSLFHLGADLFDE